MGFGNFDFKKPNFKKISDVVWEIDKNFKQGMNVPVRVFGSKKILDGMDLQVFDQASNVATLPGIQKYSFVMPDGHSGYGFSIGGVAAMDIENGGVISPGGIGFDINCGMRLLTTNLTYDQVKPHLKELVNNLFNAVPAGVGSEGALKLNKQQFREAIELGGEWCVENGYGWKEDLERTEENGRMKGADATKCSSKSIERGMNQVGTLGSGNHYLEIQVVKPENIFDEAAAKAMGIFPNQVVIMFHCGSRGFGHQVATDYLQKFLSVMEKKYKLNVLDRELACAPFHSPEGQAYFSAMKCAINLSFANRQVILQRIREVFSDVFHRSPEDLGMHMVYDVAHNTAKLERYEIDGEMRELLIHRKGATRAFGPGMEGVPEVYKHMGQPVIIGGSMETGSYLLAGVKSGIETFFSTAHGSGRTMSRTKAKKLYQGKKLQEEMAQRGIYVRTVSYSGLAEEDRKSVV